ncbi:hypothetical protein, partial [Streptomyces mirabilis]|uniref:hypothetical protein n=1 Tax=Streptomyces mirabilis TaxID=68239 RepID=UPI003664921F
VILLRADDITVVPVTDPAGTIVAAGHAWSTRFSSRADRVTARAAGRAVRLMSSDEEGGWPVQLVTFNDVIARDLQEQGTPWRARWSRPACRQTPIRTCVPRS